MLESVHVSMHVLRFFFLQGIRNFDHLTLLVVRDVKMLIKYRADFSFVNMHLMANKNLLHLLGANVAFN
jgi:hypothetical protein